MNGYASKAVRGFIIVFLFSAVAAAFSYATRILLARWLSPQEYGLFSAVSVFLGLVVFFRGLGFTGTLNKYIPDYMVKGQAALATKLVRFVLVVNEMVGTVLAIILWSMSGFLAANYFRSPEAGQVLTIMLFTMLIADTRFISRLVFQAYQKHFLFGIQYLTETILLFASIILGTMFLSPTAFVAATLHLLAFATVTFLFAPFLIRLTGLFGTHTNRPLHLRGIVRFALFSALTSLGSIVILYTDTLIITLYRTLEEVGIYNAVVPTVMMLNFFGMIIMQVFGPMSAELWARKNDGAIAEGLHFININAAVIILPAVIVMVAYPTNVLGVLFGAEYSGGAQALATLALGGFFMMFYTIASNMLSSVGRPEKATYALLWAALANLILNFVLIPSMGMLGAAISSLISYGIALVLAEYSLAQYVRIYVTIADVSKIVGASALFGSVIVLGKQHADNSLLFMLVIIALAGVLYVASLWYLRIIDPKKLRSLLKSSLAKRLR